MRILKITAIVAALSFVGAYAASPYTAASGFTGALEEYDAQAASEYIDYPSVRQGVKDDMNAEIAQMTLDSDGDPFAVAGAAFAGSLVSGMIDGFISPSGLEKILERAESKKSENFMKVGYETQYDGIDRFLVRIVRNVEGREIANPLVLTFERRGLFSWKLVKIDLPFDEFRKSLSGSDNPEADESPTFRDIPSQFESMPEESLDEDIRMAEDYEQPGFFYDVDEDGNPIEEGGDQAMPPSKEDAPDGL